MALTDFDPIIFQCAFEKWFNQCDALLKADGREELGYHLEYKFGRKYISIIKNTKNQRSQWGFVDMETGNILKSAGWAKPETKHPRGNIFDEHGGMKYINWTGPMYMDSIKAIETEEEDWNNPEWYPE